MALLHGKLMRRLDPKSYDPLQFFPAEIIHMIINQLNMREKVYVYLLQLLRFLTRHSNCLSVSRGWKRILEGSEAFWHNLDMSSVRKPVSQASLRVALKRAKFRVQKIHISHKAFFDLPKMEFLLKHCKDLDTLEFSGYGELGASLEPLTLAKNLRTLNIGGKHKIAVNTMFAVLERVKHTIVTAIFTNVLSLRTTPRWPKLDVLESLTIHMDLLCRILDLVKRSIFPSF